VEAQGTKRSRFRRTYKYSRAIYKIVSPAGAEGSFLILAGRGGGFSAVTSRKMNAPKVSCSCVCARLHSSGLNLILVPARKGVKVKDCLTRLGTMKFCTEQ
jgi:hypothetical protein